MRRSTDALLDVAVVGGGVSGTFVAHRLRQARPDCAVTLFEASDRIGDLAAVQATAALLRLVGRG